MNYSNYSICPKCRHFLDPYSDICYYCGYKTKKGGETMNNTENIFPSRLKDARKAKGLSQPELAEAVLVSTSSMCGYEKGKTFPSIDTAARIAKVLGVSLDYLAGLDNN